MYLVQLLQIKAKAPFVGLSPPSMYSAEQSESRKNKKWNTMVQVKKWYEN